MITILAWIFGILSTCFTVLRVYGFLTYSERDRMRDYMRGQNISYPVIIPGSIAIVCWVWIIV